MWNEKWEMKENEGVNKGVNKNVKTKVWKRKCENEGVETKVWTRCEPKARVIKSQRPKSKHQRKEWLNPKEQNRNTKGKGD